MSITLSCDGQCTKTERLTIGEKAVIIHTYFVAASHDPKKAIFKGQFCEHCLNSVGMMGFTKVGQNEPNPNA